MLAIFLLSLATIIINGHAVGLVDILVAVLIIYIFILIIKSL